MANEDNLSFDEYLNQFDGLPSMYIKDGIEDTETKIWSFKVYHNFKKNSFSIDESNLT